MTNRDPRAEDGGYGAGNLVGSSESGLRSAIEARHAVDAARAPRERSVTPSNADLGRLADRGPLEVGAAGDETPAARAADQTRGTRASTGRSDTDRDPRDDANSLQD